MAALVLLLREEGRGRTESRTVRYSARDWKILFRSVPLRYLYLGYALFGLDLRLVGAFAGLISVAAGVPGTILGGYVSDRLRRTGRGGRMLFSACAALASVPLWLALLFSNNYVVLASVNFILLGLVLMWVGPAAADVHEIAGPHLRGLGIGIYFFTVTIAAYGVGSLLIGRLNDWADVAARPQMMRYTLLVCPAACALGALLLWLGSRRLEED